MVLMAYLSGLITPLAVALGVAGGLRWWRALRRAQLGSEEVKVEVVEDAAPPLPVPPQGHPVLNRASRRVVPRNVGRKR